MSNRYKVIAKTGDNITSLGSLSSLGNSPSINDSGYTAFVGISGFNSDLLVDNGVENITNLTVPYTDRFANAVQINNQNKVVARNLRASGNSGIWLWDFDNPNSFQTVATGYNPSAGYDFETILPFPSVNNNSETVFLADPNGSSNTAIATPNGTNFLGNRAFNQIVPSVGYIRPMVADNGKIVFRDPASKILLYNYDLSPAESIASDFSGFSYLGASPGISDDGKVVTFYGELTNPSGSTLGLQPGAGIFASIDKGSGRKIIRLAGIAGNGIKDPGETFDDANQNGLFDAGEDKGLITSFAKDDRVGVSYIGDGNTGTVVYLARNQANQESLFSGSFELSADFELKSIEPNIVAQVGDPANKISSELTGNIQDLNIYDPVNQNGEIAFWAKTTTAQEAIVREDPVLKPILIVPGIVGSLPKNEDIAQWITNRGFSPDKLQPEQITNIYDDLVETLKRAGYVEGVNLFVATYDWRLNPGPIDGTIDGVINRSVEDLTDQTYEYSVDQFAFWLKKSIDGWKSQFSDLPPEQVPELDSVDVIAHSAGGATVRSYIQSDGYGQVFDNSSGTKLPKINDFISLGVPYRGVSLPWNGLNNDFDGGAVLRLAKLIAKAAYVKAKNGQTISLSGQNNVPEAITPQEVNTQSVEQFIEDYVPHLRALLATYPFIKDSSGNFKTAEELDPQQRNTLLLDLNDGFDSQNNEGGGDLAKFADKIRQLTVVHSSGIPANDAVLQKVGPDFQIINPTPSTTVNQLIPSIATLERGNVAPKADEVWYENLKGEGDPQEKGDGAIPGLSAYDPNFFGQRPNIVSQDFLTVQHGNQPFDLEVQKYILETLNLDLPENLISTELHQTGLGAGSIGLGSDAISFGGEFIQDPVEGFLVDGQGRRLGYTTATGAVTEIPNSAWIGEADGIGFFTEPVQGPFELQLTGLGEDYYVSVALETENGPAGIESSGFLAAGEQLTLDVPVNNSPFLDLSSTSEGINFNASLTPPQQTVVIADNTLKIFDKESTNISGATVTITNPQNGASEFLSATVTGNIAVAYDGATGKLTLTGVDTIANYEQVLKSVTYNNNAVSPNLTPRQIEFIVNDGANFNNLSTVATTTLTLNLNLNGNSGNDTLIGGPGNDLLRGLAGNDSLNGKAGKDTLDGGLGNDTMIGDIGNDTYIVDSSTDLINEASTATGEIDTVQSSITYTLGSNLENLTLTGTSAINGTGNTLNNAISGNAANNQIDGGVGDDTLIGNTGNDTVTGGAGNDTMTGGSGGDLLTGGADNDAMTGGSGGDTYVVDSTGDSISETSSTATEIDSVQSSVTYTLGTNLENLTLTGTNGINGTGNTTDNSITGNSANNQLDGSTGNDTMTGDTGNDTYVVDSTGDVVSEISTTATEIDTVQTSATYTLGANVENLTLTGTSAINATGNAMSNSLEGNSANNNLSGGIGDDTFIGGAGIDTLIGGAGNDLYTLDTTTDTITENVNEGTDTVASSVTYTLGANVENLYLTGSTAISGVGNSLNNSLTGNAADNSLTGSDGDDTLSGAAGLDTMTGGVGNDIYIVDATGDVVSETSTTATEIDSVQSSITYTLGSNLENLTLTGTSGINGTGNSMGNSITGNIANNQLDGSTGNDTMAGGVGNDIYIVNSTGDVVSETSTTATEIDSVESRVNYTLGANLENLILAGTNGIKGTGNTLNNTITGNTANNTLSGGTGNDTMTGGTGNDTYVVDATGDSISETSTAATEIDSVQSRVTYTLGSNLENLTLTSTSAINGTGNTTGNVLTGNSGNNTMNGGAGIDTLIGGAGNDSMDGGSGIDSLLESGNFNFTLTNTSLTGNGTDVLTSIEAATLTGGSSNNILNASSFTLGAVRLDGSSGNDTMTGGTGNDLLTGGSGNDSLTGGGGSDGFIYDTNAAFTNSAVGIDLFADFVSGTDKIVLDKTTFTALTSVVGSGFSVASELAVVASDGLAATAGALIVYSSGTGNLFYNQNGVTTGLGSGEQFATLSDIPALSANDFVLQA